MKNWEINKDQFNKEQNIIIGGINGPQGTDIKSKQRKDTYLQGNYNINLLNIDKQSAGQDFCRCHVFPLFILCYRKTNASDWYVSHAYNSICYNR